MNQSDTSHILPGEFAALGLVKNIKLIEPIMNINLNLINLYLDNVLLEDRTEEDKNKVLGEISE